MLYQGSKNLLMQVFQLNQKKNVYLAKFTECVKLMCVMTAQLE